MKPGDLVMPKENFLRTTQSRPTNNSPGILVERIITSRTQLPGSDNGWQVIWRGDLHVMFESEFALVEGSNV